MPFIPLALSLFFQNRSFTQTFQFPNIVSCSSVDQSTDDDVTLTSIFLKQNNSAPVHTRSKVIHASKWRAASVLFYWEFLFDFSVFIMITMDGYKGRQIACLFMTWLSYASTYLLRKPLGVVSLRTLLSDMT